MSHPLLAVIKVLECVLSIPDGVFSTRSEPYAVS